MKQSVLNSHVKTQLSRLRAWNEPDKPSILFMPNSCCLHLPMTHLRPTPTEPFPPRLQSNKSGLPLMGRRGAAIAAPRLQALQGSSSALPFPCSSLGADLQTVQGWALPKHQQDEGDRSKVEIKGGQEAEKSTPPSHPSCFLPGPSSALSSPNTSVSPQAEIYPRGCFSPQAFMFVLLIFTTAALFFSEEQHPVDFSSS